MAIIPSSAEPGTSGYVRQPEGYATLIRKDENKWYYPESMFPVVGSHTIWETESEAVSGIARKKPKKIKKNGKTRAEITQTDD